jgi:hypothetical protein
MNRWLAKSVSSLVTGTLVIALACVVLFAQEPQVFERGLTILRGNVVVGSGLLEIRGTSGVATAAVLAGGGTSASPATTSSADKNFLGFWTKSTATSGDSRGLYLRHYIMGAGGAGEAARFYTTVDDVAAAGTVNGAHISLSFAADGSATGASNALRATYDIAESGNPGSTAAVAQIDTNFGKSATVPTNFAFLRFDNVGTAPTTNGAPLLFNVTNANTSTMFVAAAGTGAGECAQTGGVVFAKTLKVRVDGTDYWIGLCTAP